MKKIFLFALFFFFCMRNCIGQGEENVWMMANYGLDFNAGSPVVIESSDGFGWASMEGTATVSDAEGNLLFYSNGDSIFNRENELMPAGNGIVPGLLCWSTTQSCTVVPVPGSTRQYYVFSLGYNEEPMSGGDFAGNSLYFNIVDMTMDGGLGDVLTADASVYITDSLTEKMTVVRRDCGSIWLIVCKVYSNEFYAYLITAEGITGPVVSPSVGGWAGDIRFSNNKSMMAVSSIATHGPALAVYDFSLFTGEFYNRRILIDSVETISQIYSACFSPDDSKLYAAGLSELSQFDLSYTLLEDIIASRQMLGSCSGLPTVKLGPDNKLYVNNVHTIGCVNNPNAPGMDCDYVADFFDFGADDYVFGSFPNATIPQPAYTDTVLTSSDTAICMETTLYGRSYVDNYLWNTGATTDHILIDTPGTYYVASHGNCNFFVDTFHISIGGLYPPVLSTRDTALCRMAGSVILSVTVDSAVDATYYWEPEYAIISGGESPAALVDPSLASLFYITVTNHLGFCEESTTDSIAVNMFSSEPTIITPDTAICAGDSILLTAILPVGGYTGYWSPELGLSTPDSATTWLRGIETTNYIFTSSLRPCYSNDTVHIIVEPVPVVYAGNDTLICDYDQVELSPVVIPADFTSYNYMWEPGTYLSDAFIRNPRLHAPAGYTGTLRLLVSTPLGCSGSDSLNVSVATSRFMEISTHDTGMCAPVSLPLAASNAISYLWLPEYGLSDNKSATPIASPGYSTSYLVMGVSAEGCVDSQYVLVQVYPDATVVLPDTVHIDMGDTYLIKPEGNGVSFQWSPPNGLNAIDIPTPLASPDIPTRYFCTVTNEYGCFTTDSIDILINSVLDLPNAFVPGSGPNSTFKVLVWGSATLKSFVVFNRWGNKVFETTNIQEGWDGTYNGIPQPVGIYMYMVEAVSNTGRPFIQQGNVMLIR